MLAKKYRLSAEDFLSSGRYFLRSEHFALKFWPNQSKFNRYGVSIAARIEKSAVRRHSLKRKIYENLKSWPNQGLNILFVYNKKISNPEITVRDEMLELLGGVLKKQRTK
ncbi:MAG: ribonuclease P protein component [Patescibacteria group bacterium]